MLILHQNNVPLDCIHRWTLGTRDGSLQVCLRWKLNRSRNSQLLIISDNGIAMWLILLKVLFMSTLDTRYTRPCYLLNKFCCMLTNHFTLESTIYHANFWSKLKYSHVCRFCKKIIHLKLMLICFRRKFKVFHRKNESNSKWLGDGEYFRKKRSFAQFIA